MFAGDRYNSWLIQSDYYEVNVVPKRSSDKPVCQIKGDKMPGVVIFGFPRAVVNQAKSGKSR